MATRNWNNDRTNELIDTLRRCKSGKEMKAFLRDLLTEDEIVEFGKRWETARMLAAGIPYAEISTAVKLSSRTIARIARWLNKGAGGYRAALRRVKRSH